MSEQLGLALIKVPLTYQYSTVAAVAWFFVLQVVAVVASLGPARNAVRLTIREVWPMSRAEIARTERTACRQRIAERNGGVQQDGRSERPSAPLISTRCRLLDLRRQKAYRTPAGDFHALKGIDLQVRAGEFVAVTGKSGAGKSTLINMVTGIDRPTAGQVRVGRARRPPA